MLDISDINVFMAFGAGFLSFISPCVLPLYPAFLSYITGMSVNALKEENKMLNRNSLLHTIFFLLGFSVIFISMGGFISSLSDFLTAYQNFIREIGALLIIFFGLVIVGIFNFEFLMKDRKMVFKNRPTGFFGSFMIGLAFSLGWTPCMGPILAVVMTSATTTPDVAFVMMMSYVLGFSIPFLAMAFFIGKIDWIRKNGGRIVKIGGYVMIFMGIALFFDWMTKLTSYLAGLFGFSGF